MKKSIGRREWSVVGVLVISLLSSLMWTPGPAFSAWTVGKPITTYWAGPTLDTATAQQMAQGGWNLVWARTVAELDVAQANGLRAMWGGSLSNAMIELIRDHPALNSYYVVDEPPASEFSQHAATVTRLHELDPNHMAYINLFPTYATGAQLSGTSVPITYSTYLSEYMRIVNPELLSYDNYPFYTQSSGDPKYRGDGCDYFRNLAIISHTAKQRGIPFLQIVQACSWDAAVMRVPTGSELRYLFNTSLAYGAQGISEYVYYHSDHTGGMANEDGTTTPLYDTAKTLNPEFVAVVQELQSTFHIGAYHLGDLPPGYDTIDGSSPMRLPDDSPFTLSGMPDTDYITNAPVKGAVLGLWGPDGLMADATMAFIVNLDYLNELTTTVTGPDDLSLFDPTTGLWTSTGSRSATLTLEPGGGMLVGLTSMVPEPSALVLFDRRPDLPDLLRLEEKGLYQNVKSLRDVYTFRRICVDSRCERLHWLDARRGDETKVSTTVDQNSKSPLNRAKARSSTTLS